MGINVYWKSEDGSVLDELPDHQNFLTRLACCNSDKLHQTACLRFLDPAGDLCLNQRQIPVFADELRRELQKVGDPNQRKHLEQVLELAEKAKGVHTYLWFEGD